MNREDAENRAYSLAEDHWAYIENLLWAHGEKVEKMEVAKYHYKEAFKHGYKHAWEDQLAGFEFPSDQSMDNWVYELSSHTNQTNDQASKK
jgi:hypothetical protein